MRRLKQFHTSKPGFQRKVVDDLKITASGCNSADRFVTLLLDEMEIKENLILVKHREPHWFY